jgi:hypothetical protein
MPLLLLNDQHAIDRRNDPRTRIAAAEGRCAPKQTSNDEGRPWDLQIGVDQRAHVVKIHCNV